MKIRPLLKNTKKQDLPSQDSLREEYRAAKNFGEVRLGTDHLFHRSFLFLRFIPFSQCERIYLRVEYGEYGEFPVHENYVIVDTKRGDELKLRVDRPSDGVEAIAFLQEAREDVKLGKKKEEKSAGEEEEVFHE